MKVWKKNNNGITLIALVITIIILLILAGISIASLTGSGLFDKAKEAKNKSEEAQELENSMLAEYEKELIKASIKNIDMTKTNPVDAMPNGATLIEGDGNKGIVIKDSKENEWTWVEVPKTIFTTVDALEKNPTKETLNTAIKTDLINYVTNYRESGYEDKYYDGCGIEATSEKTAEQVYNEMYEKMLNSIYTNGGFWISRYEAGIAGSNENTNLARYEHTDIGETSPKAVSQVDMIPYNFVTYSEAQKLASKMSADESKTSSLLFGIQWDLTCKYIDEKAESTITKSDCSSWGNYADSSLKLDRGKYNIKAYNPEHQTWTEFSTDIPNYVTSSQTSSNASYSQLLTTGASEQTNKMNIYDFAGNEWEWTLEQCTSYSSGPCAFRGGGLRLQWL